MTLPTPELIAKIGRALEVGGGTHALEDVLQALEKGDAQLWEAPGVFIVTQIEEFPRGKALRFWLAAGDLQAVLAMQDKIYTWGREQGCDRAVMAGRKGWARVLASEGWAPTMVHYERRLDG